MLVKDVKWFIRTCHERQIRQTRQLHIPPTVPVIGGLFYKVHLHVGWPNIWSAQELEIISHVMCHTATQYVWYIRSIN